MSNSSTNEDSKVLEIVQELGGQEWMLKVNQDIDACLEAVDSVTHALTRAVKPSNQLILMDIAIQLAQAYEAHVRRFRQAQQQAVQTLEDIQEGKSPKPVQNSMPTPFAGTQSPPWGVPQIDVDDPDGPLETSNVPPF